MKFLSKKFITCALPYPIFSKKNKKLKYIFYNKLTKKIKVDDNLYQILGNIIENKVCYHYEINSGVFYNDLYTNKIHLQRANEFIKVIEDLYDYPESFLILEKYQKEYSKQELSYLKRLQNYLLFIGLKDKTISKEEKEIKAREIELINKKKLKFKERIEIVKLKRKEKKIHKKEKLRRYKSTNALKYSDYHHICLDNKQINAILNKKIDYQIFLNNKNVLNEKYFLIDEDDNYVGILEYVSEEKMHFCELEENMVNIKANGFKNFLDYKNDLFEYLKRESMLDGEKFLENSLILYVKFTIRKINY